jgi:hypothetical protein
MAPKPCQYGVGQDDNPFRIGRSLQPKQQRRKRIASRQIIFAECTFVANLYPKGIKVSDEEMQAINITRDEFHGEWNYTISPN